MTERYPSRLPLAAGRLGRVPHNDHCSSRAPCYRLRTRHFTVLAIPEYAAVRPYSLARLSCRL